jgi:hypothetical protein
MKLIFTLLGTHMFLLWLLLAFALNGCAFLISTAGSFLGNLGAELAHEEIKNNREMKDAAYCDPMGVQNCPTEGKEK